MPASKAYTVPTIFTAVDRFSRPVTAMGNAMSSFISRSEVGLSRAERGWTKLMAPIRSVNKMLMGLGLYIGLYSLFRILSGIVGVIAQYEQSQINIQSVSTASIRDNKMLGLEARKVAVAYGQAASGVAALQFELLKMGFTANDVQKMTEPISTGARALRTSPERLSEVAAGILLSYNKDAGQTKDVINKLAYAANLTAADFESYATQLPIVNRVAFLSGQSYEKVLAYLGTLRNVQIHTATGATSLKNIIIDAAKNGMDFRKAIEKVAKSNNAVVYAANKFGKRSVVSAVEFSRQLDFIDKLVEKIKAAPSDYVTDLAKKQLSGLNGMLTLTKSAWEEFILSIDEGNGPIGRASKGILTTVRAMLLFASGSDASVQAMNDIDMATLRSARKYLHWINIITKAILLVAALRVGMYLWRTAIIANTVATVAWNSVLAISVALGITNAATVRWNAVSIWVLIAATRVMTAVTWLWTAAQTAVNAAMFANPIGAMVLALAALAGYTYLVVTHWNSWGAALSMTSGPLGLMLTLIQSFRRNWDMIVEAFQSEGILGGIKAIGRTIIDALVMPVQQIYHWLSKLPEALGGAQFSKMEKAISLWREKGLGVNTETDENGVPIARPHVKRNANWSDEDQKIFEKMMLGKIQVDFGNVPQGTNVKGSVSGIVGAITPRLGSTMGF